MFRPASSGYGGFISPLLNILVVSFIFLSRYYFSSCPQIPYLLSLMSILLFTLLPCIPTHSYTFRCWILASCSSFYPRSENQRETDSVQSVHLQNVVAPNIFNPSIVYDGRALAYLPGRALILICMLLGQLSVDEGERLMMTSLFL
jgi:hypothetical protein